ncbi:MAG: hypothetical protein WAX61_00165, partial [Lactococcus raffinolactis]
MKMKPVALGAGLLLAASLCLLVGCGSGNKKSERSKESSSSKSSLSKSSAKPSSKTDINTNDNSSQNSEEGTSGNAQAGSGQTSTATQELATLQTSIQGKIALALAKMASQTPGMVSAERLKTEPNLTFSKKAVIYSTETERNIPVLDAAGRPLEEYRTGWKVNEKLDTELREFKNYIFQSLLETCNQELNASFLYCNRSQC